MTRRLLSGARWRKRSTPYGCAQWGGRLSDSSSWTKEGRLGGQERLKSGSRAAGANGCRRRRVTWSQRDVGESVVVWHGPGKRVRARFLSTCLVVVGGRREGGRQGGLVVSRPHGQSEYRRIRIEEVSRRVMEE
jgi:hypothetical protein